MPHVMSKADQDFCTSFWDSLLNSTSWAQCLQSRSEIILICRSSGKEKSMATWPARKRSSESCFKQAQRHASSSLYSQADAHATELNGAGWKFKESHRMSSLIWCVLHLRSDVLHSESNSAVRQKVSPDGLPESLAVDLMPFPDSFIPGPI